jgi:hypothetical protein
MNFYTLPTNILNGTPTVQHPTFTLKTGNGSCKSTQEEYSYKVISSIIKNTSISGSQLNGIQTTKYGANSPLRNYYTNITNSITHLS